MFGRVTNLLYFCTQIYFAMLFQDKLKELRESHNLLQRQVAAGIDMDTAVYCKKATKGVQTGTGGTSAPVGSFLWYSIRRVAPLLACREGLQPC